MKVKFVLNITKLDNLPLSCTKSLVYVSWKRGLKPENKGETDRVLCKKDSVIFNHKIEIAATLVQDVNTEKWKTKEKDLILRIFALSKKLGKGKKPAVEGEKERLKSTEVTAIKVCLLCGRVRSG